MDFWDPNIVFFPWFLALEAKGMDGKSGSSYGPGMKWLWGHTPHYDQHRFVVYNIYPCYIYIIYICVNMMYKLYIYICTYNMPNHSHYYHSKEFQTFNILCRIRRRLLQPSGSTCGTSTVLSISWIIGTCTWHSSQVDGKRRRHELHRVYITVSDHMHQGSTVNIFETMKT